MGQLLAVISQPENIRLQFFVDPDNLKYLNLGQAATLKYDGQEDKGKITSVSQQADDLTKRFLIEVTPDFADKKYTLGTVIGAAIEIEKMPEDQNNIILPISAIEIGQNNNTVYIVDQGKAKKVEVKIIRVEGETAEVSVDLPMDAKIIIKNNKLVQDGSAVSVQQ